MLGRIGQQDIDQLGELAPADCSPASVKTWLDTKLDTSCKPHDAALDTVLNCAVGFISAECYKQNGGGGDAINTVVVGSETSTNSPTTAPTAAPTSAATIGADGAVQVETPQQQTLGSSGGNSLERSVYSVLTAAVVAAAAILL
jgi:hypothetical protein